MKSISTRLISAAKTPAVASVGIMLCQTVALHAAPDAARVAGDLKVDGLHFSVDGSVIRKLTDLSSPWTISNTDIYFPAGGKVGIGRMSPSSELDVAGTIKATQFSGDGSGLANVWKTTGNAGATPGTNFIGTTDNQAFEIKVNNTRAIRIEPTNYAPNITFGDPSNVAGGTGVTGATVSGGGLARANCWDLATNTATRSCANKVTAGYSFVGGGYSNFASGDVSTIGGGYNNTTSGGISTICGGNLNTASGVYSFIGGGYSNTVSDNSSTISGGLWNTAGYRGTVGGGGWNHANGQYSTISGGDWNTANGLYSTICGGAGNYTSGDYGFACGRNAYANNTGSFVWADSNNGGSELAFHSNANDEFAVRARGGVRLVTAIAPDRTFAINSNGDVGIDPAASLNFGSTTRQMINLWGSVYGIGVQAYTGYFRTDGDFAWYKQGVHSDAAGDAGGGTTLMKLTTAGLTVNGTFVSASDRNKKENFEEIDARQILEKVANLPIQHWNYKDDNEKTRHIGPMAQDFYAAFGVGADDRHIATVDADGIALAAIKALKAENDALKERLERVEKLLSILKP